MATWKEKESRKKKKDQLQTRWKDLMECVATWEELQEDELHNNEDLLEWSCGEWSEAGFTDSGGYHI